MDLIGLCIEDEGEVISKTIAKNYPAKGFVQVSTTSESQLRNECVYVTYFTTASLF